MSERIFGSVLLSIVLLLTSCNGSSNSSTPGPVGQAASPSPPASPSPLTEFEEDLQYVRNGGFTYIWVFTRKDGKPLDKNDTPILHSNAPQVVDWAVTNGGKSVIGGTNFNLEEGNLDLLRKRYVIENYSGR